MTSISRRDARALHRLRDAGYAVVYRDTLDVYTQGGKSRPTDVAAAAPLVEVTVDGVVRLSKFDGVTSPLSVLGIVAGYVWAGSVRWANTARGEARFGGTDGQGKGPGIAWVFEPEPFEVDHDAEIEAAQADADLNARMFAAVLAMAETYPVDANHACGRFGEDVITRCAVCEAEVASEVMTAGQHAPSCAWREAVAIREAIEGDR